MANNYWPWDDAPTTGPTSPQPMPPVLGNPAPAYPHGQVPAMPSPPWDTPAAMPGPWTAESEAKLIAARKSVSELEKVKQRAIDRIAASLSPSLGAGVSIPLLVANAKRVRAALEQFDHDV